MILQLLQTDHMLEFSSKLDVHHEPVFRLLGRRSIGGLARSLFLKNNNNNNNSPRRQEEGL